MNPYTQEILNLLDDGKLTKRLSDSIALKHGIEDKTIQKELTELAVVFKAREIANQSGTILEKYKQIVELYRNQVILSFRTSQSIMLQQYSTPAPIAYIAGAYVLYDQPQNYQIFEPSAGNGLLTIAFDSQKVVVNEVDENRYNNLKLQPFKQVTRVDATQNLVTGLFNFEKLFDGIITNPPFGTLDKPFTLGKYRINNLDHLMAIRALDCMYGNGRAAIIIGGHTHYDDKGRVQAGKNRIFLTYLYSHYNVDDVINIDGSLYSRQGTSFDVRLILIDGRKSKPEGFPPLKNADSEPVTDFDSLCQRVSIHLNNVEKQLWESTVNELIKFEIDKLEIFGDSTYPKWITDNCDIPVEDSRTKKIYNGYTLFKASKDGLKHWGKIAHYNLVKKAIIDGKQVPEIVLNEYPQFKKIKLVKAKAKALILIQEQNGLSGIGSNYLKSLKQFFANAFKGRLIEVAYPKDFLLKNSFPNKLIGIRPTTLAEKVKQHNLTYNQLKNLPTLINNPLMLFKSKTISGAFNIIIEKENSEGLLCCSIHPDKRIDQMIVNEIASIHGRNVDQLINWVNSGLLVDAQIKKIEKVFSDSGFNSPKSKNLLDLLSAKI